MNIALPLAAVPIGGLILASAWTGNDVAIVVSAGAGAFVLVGGFLWKIVLELKTLRVAQESTHKLVNSVAENLKARAKELAEAEATIARLEGEKAGIEAEREKPMIQATVVDETVLTKERELTEAKKAELKAKAEKPKRRAKK